MSYFNHMQGCIEAYIHNNIYKELRVHEKNIHFINIRWVNVEYIVYGVYNL